MVFIGILAWFLVAYGIVCILGAICSCYIPLFLFYHFFPGSFAIKLIIALLFGVAQVVFGVYLILKKKGKQVRWYWLAGSSPCGVLVL